MIKLGRLTVAAVWLYEGLWSKILAHSQQQQSVLAAVPAFSGHVDVVQTLIGIAEVALGLWILTAYRPGAAAIAQIVLLASMNLAGLLFAHHFMNDPLGMVVHNTAFLTLAWIISQPCDRRVRAS